MRLRHRIEAFAVKRLSKKRRLRKRITIVLDPSVDPTQGQQPFAYFNGFYDSWCYLPMFGFLSIEGEADQYLCHARLRAGTSKEAKGTPALLRRLVTLLRQRCPQAPICVRLDAGFAYPQILSCLEELKVEYMVGMPENAVLARHSEEHMRAAENLTDKFGQTTTFFGESIYKAGSWKPERRVIFKAEVVQADGKSHRRNARYVVTNRRLDPEKVWKLYCMRGDSENRIKELKHDLQIDRTSCTACLPNQFRVLLAAAAFVLSQELRRSLKKTALSRATVGTLRVRLLKIGPTVTESVRRIVVSMPSRHPWKDLWRLATLRVANLS